MPQLMVVLDDKTAVPLRDCFWVKFGPDSCAVGSLTGDSAADADTAHRDFTTRQRDRDRETRKGYRVELLTREQWKEQAQACFLGKCQHRQAVAS